MRLLFVLSIQENLFGNYCGFKQFEHERAFENHINKREYNSKKTKIALNQRCVQQNIIFVVTSIKVSPL